jgi:hypothetical protein
MRRTSPAYQLRTILHFGVALAAVALVAAVAASAPAAAPATTPLVVRTACTDTAALVSTSQPRLVRMVVATTHRTFTYDWPVKPFDRQHPVRGNIDDPRGNNTKGWSFHFGIDIAVPDGTAVYAIEAGTASIENAEAVGIMSAGGHGFSYWHVTPAVRAGQVVARHQLIAHVAGHWQHVHLGESFGSTWVNPLRAGGIGPYADRTAPTVDEVGLDGTSLVVAAHDTPDPAVPGEWARKPVTPALVRWRTFTPRSISAWHLAVDFRSRVFFQRDFLSTYTRRTRQNHVHRPGQYCFYLQHGSSPAAGTVVQVEVRDIAGNTAVYTARLRGIGADL